MNDITEADIGRRVILHPTYCCKEFEGMTGIITEIESSNSIRVELDIQDKKTNFGFLPQSISFIDRGDIHY